MKSDVPDDYIPLILRALELSGNHLVFLIADSIISSICF
jgi:hypothetical protein